MGFVLMLYKVSERHCNNLQDSLISLVIRNKPSAEMLLKLKFSYRVFRLEIDSKLNIPLYVSLIFKLFEGKYNVRVSRLTRFAVIDFIRYIKLSLVI